MAATTYELLRDHVLDGTTSGVFGLVVLMREGIAAWLAQAAAPSLETARANDPLAAPSIVSDDVHADMICVLANLAMANSHEVHA